MLWVFFFFAVTSWGEGVHTADSNRVDKKGSPVVRSELERVQQVVVRRMLFKLKSVMNNPILPLHAMEVTNCSTVSQSDCTKVQVWVPQEGLHTSCCKSNMILSTFAYVTSFQWINKEFFIDKDDNQLILAIDNLQCYTVLIDLIDYITVVPACLFVKVTTATGI